MGKAVGKRCVRGTEYTFVRAIVLRQLAAGYSEKTIAEKNHLSLVLVKRMILDANKQFGEMSKADVEMLRGKELARLDFIADEALQMLEKAKQPKKSTTREGVQGDGSAKAGAANRRKVSETIEEAGVDTRPLETLMRVSERHSKLLGLDQPHEMRMVIQRLNEGRQAMLAAVIEVYGDLDDAADRLDKLATRLEQNEASAYAAQQGAAA